MEEIYEFWRCGYTTAVVDPVLIITGTLWWQEER